MARFYKKSWTHFFQAIKAGQKLHDVREDEGYQIGDVIVLQEYDNINGRYTGEEQEVEVSYIANRTVPCAFSSAVLSPGYCILSLKVLA
ncbi:DUF3850 domain-containing protein [Bradyrhizobium hipponense]|uniref:DUF3850 domain-containing protein n=1 Tax=Bradyrhizobium hipponense TaxID=2605638 RepID=A0A5S4YQ53_9BRAD|nr:DUF3850 domain-containing protein [Bradyrhizobium hipponense]TYO65567.1 DUF3850 domain-containing protein [Bradyrhizobium hipponense]